MPSVLGVATTAEIPSNQTNIPITLPAGIQAGEFLLCAFSADAGAVASIVTGVGWVLLAQATNGANVTGAILYKPTASGDANDALTVGLAPAERATAICYRISPSDPAVPPVQTNA